MWIILLLYFSGVLFIFYLISRLTLGITKSATCLVGKTAIVTGANSGLGYKTALNLASRGCRVIMADVADMTESQLKIIKYTNNPNIATKKLDLSSLKSVRDFAANIVKTEDRLHILVNNAGIGACAENRTANNLHPLMQINFFGHFLLTHLLIGLLKESAPSRIVFTSSLMAFINNLTLSNLNFDVSTYNNVFSYIQDIMVYGNSKLAMIIASDIFAEKLKGTGVTSNSVHPGLVSTPIFGKYYSVNRKLGIKAFIELSQVIGAKDAWEGSQTIVHAAVSNKLADVTGQYFVDCKPFIKPWYAYNKKFCKQIWEATEEYVMLKSEEKLIFGNC